MSSQRGAASVETAAITVLVGAIVVACLALLAVEGTSPAPSRELGSSIARKVRCAAAAPNLAGGRGACWRDPLTLAYGRSLAGAVRALAPAPTTRPGPAGEPMLAVHFRHCRRPSCAMPGRSAGLTASNRRVTVFTSVDDGRRAGGPVRIEYWHYRPHLRWERVSRLVGRAEVASLASTPLLESAVPRLVALETLAGRDHVRFRAVEEPPWRWRVESVVPP